MSVSLRAEVETYRSSVKRDANPYKEMLNSAVAERDAVNERMQDATEGRADIETYADYVEYVALKGQSFPVVDGHFKYNLIVMDKLEQREKEGHGVNTLGSFDGIRLEPDGAVVMTFTDGDYCWATQGPRTAEVRVTCAPENRLASVTEPSVCNYHAAFESPAACNPLYAEHVLGMSI
jgi:protein kinase C substrate 80K-H